MQRTGCLPSIFNCFPRTTSSDKTSGRPATSNAVPEFTVEHANFGSPLAGIGRSSALQNARLNAELLRDISSVMNPSNKAVQSGNISAGEVFNDSRAQPGPSFGRGIEHVTLSGLVQPSAPHWIPLGISTFGTNSAPSAGFFSAMHTVNSSLPQLNLSRVMDPSKRNLEQLNLPLRSVIASETLLKAVQSGNSNASEWISFDGEGMIEARHEPGYKLIRTYVGPSRDVVNIHLSDDGQTVRSIIGHPPIAIDKLAHLVTSGIFPPELLDTLGISQDEIGKASEQSIRNASEQSALALRLQTHDVSTLPSIEIYSGTDSATKLVGQGEAHILSCASSNAGGLYTAGAGPCVIVIAVAKSTSGNPVGIAMAHVDALVKEQALDKFFASLPSGKIEVSLLAGDDNAAKLALKAADKAGATVVFAHAGHYPSEGYCAAVDQKGDIYFGNRLSLSRTHFINRRSTVFST